MRIDELNGELRSGDEILYGSSGSVVQCHVAFLKEAVEDDMLRRAVAEKVLRCAKDLLRDADLTGQYIHVIVRAEGKKKDDNAGD